MSTGNALEFIRHTEKDAQLRARLAKLSGKMALEELVEIAAEYGYHFSVEDYRSAIVQLAQGELDEEALKEVQRELGLG